MVFFKLSIVSSLLTLSSNWPPVVGATVKEMTGKGSIIDDDDEDEEDERCQQRQAVGVEDEHDGWGMGMGGGAPLAAASVVAAVLSTFCC